MDANYEYNHEDDQTKNKLMNNRVKPFDDFQTTSINNQQS